MTDLEFQEKVLEKLEIIVERQAIIKTVLLGANGDTGLVGKVDDVIKTVDKLQENHDDLNGKFKLLIGVLIGSGVLAGSTAGILKLIGG